MRAWWVEAPGPIAEGPLILGDRADPETAEGEVLVRVHACGVCRTDLHLAEGDIPVKQPQCVPGHEIVGRVVARGEGAHRFEIGERIGIAWLRSTCGTCAFCRSHRENLCTAPSFTGWDADGGYAELATVPEDFAYRLPESYTDAEVAPLLCAGIIGYRALRRAAVPEGGRLGIYGFGASAHLAAQLALFEGTTVHVMTRSPAAQRLAIELGAASAQGATDEPRESLDAAILFAPVGDLVPVALSALDRGGTLAIAGIHLTDIPPLDYARHLFQERQVRSVTANTRRDGEELLALAPQVPLRPTVTTYSLERASAALEDLASDRVNGAAVVILD